MEDGLKRGKLGKSRSSAIHWVEMWIN